ncbi:MAG: FG-GAP-like repeat-containing protein [Chryseolinea sp.]
MKTLFSTLLILLALSVQAQVTSTFDTDTDGWRLINDGDDDTLTVTHNTSGGNPGSYMSAVVPTDNYPGYFWYAPAKFLGNLTYTSLGSTLTYSQQQLVAGNNSEFNGNYYEIYSPDIVISSGTASIYYHTSPKPTLTPGWTTYTVTLDETSPWHTGSYTSSPLATRDQIKAALINVTSFALRGNYNLTANTIGLDEVTLGRHPVLISPSVTSFSPTSGQPGSSITITGNNFDPTASNNAVYFGAIAGTITNSNATQLTVTVPVGVQYGKITVINKTTGLSKKSTTPFLPTFSGGGRIIPASFSPKIDIPLSIDIEGLIIADVDGDGWSDLAVASSTAFKVIEIYRNLGLGGDITTASFAPKTTVTIPGTSTNTTGLQFVDLDGDGKLDAATSNVLATFGSAYFITFRNISTPGNIAFEAPEFWQGNTDDSSPNLVADIDGDGRPELIGGEGPGWIAQNISTLGNIEFGPSIYLSTSGFVEATLGDLDNDGKPELLVSKGSSPSQSFYVLKNNSTPGNISLANLGEITTDNHAIQIADFNLDGKNDIAFRYYGGSLDIRIRLNTNSGGALALTDFTTEVAIDGDLSTYGGMSVADINGDGKLDIIATDNADVGVFENVYAGGVFDANAFIPAYEHQGNGGATYPTSPIMADLNGDQKPEIIFGATNFSPKKISIYENKNIHAPVISVNTIFPLNGPIGSTVTITGNNFSLIPSENKVWFGGVEATVLTSTANLITAKVPAGANNAPVSVTKDGLTSRYRLPFQITFGPGVTFDNTHFAPPVNFTLAGANYNLDIGDLNRDGKPDIIAGGTASNAYAFRDSHTTGSISSTSLIADDTIANAIYPRLEDLDGDGYLDVMSVNGPLLKNNSTLTEISFLPPVNVPLGSTVVDFADFNNDGKTDMTLTTDLSGAGDLIVLENRTLNLPGNFVSGAYGFFSGNFVFNKPSANGATITGDFDGDGFADIVTTNPGTDNVSIYRNLGVLKISQAQFATRVDVTVGDDPNRIYKGDFDSDGKLDLLLYHWTGTSTTLLIVLQNTSTAGNISFSRIDLTNPNAVTVAHIADLDGDGKPEILTTSEANNQFFIFKNLHASGALTSASFGVPFSTTVTAPRAITTADINLDGKPEIILTRAAGLLVIYENLVPSGPTISISTQPTFTYACEGSSGTFSVDATGTTNITYRWQKFDGTVFADLNEGLGYTGTSTKTLSINTATTGFSGNGEYRCRINGDLAPEVFSDDAQLTINGLPSPPDVTGASKCVSPSTVTLTATGGSDGDYNWYDVPTGGSVLGVNGLFTTPSITVTTTYYVSIEDTFCESTRAPVVATIALLSKPTLTSSEPIVSGSIDICDGENCTLNAPAGFALYTWSTGETTQQITANTTDAYSVVVEDAGGCTSPSSDPVNVIVNPFPDAEISINGIQLTASPGDTYQWYQNGIEVTGATTQSFDFNVLEYGVYLVDVTDNGCKATSDEFIYVITDLEKNTNGLKVYPNPVEENLFVEFNPPYTIQVIGVTGNVIQNLNAQSIPSSLDFSSMAKGIYFLKIKNESHTQYLRIIKK